MGEDAMVKVATAVPGSLGIILAIATFIFMAWFVKDNQRQNEKREERLAGIIERDLTNQRSQLEGISEANRMQRLEHQTIIDNQKASMGRQDAMLGLLQTMTGILTTGNKSSRVTS